MYDVMGAVVWGEQTVGSRGNMNIDVSGMPAGIYLVRFVADGRVLMSEKLVVER
jgi:hypothetical protein